MKLIIIEQDEEPPLERGYTTKSYISTLEKGLILTYTPNLVL
jgi:hypothetical protein